jgi:very-short-patch-repair endonuclease
MENTRFRKNSIEVQTAARAMRKQPTPAEAVLWRELRGNALGVRFRRQHPVGRFILDFWCPAARLVIEVDGDIHDLRTERDAARTEMLVAFDYYEIRFRNEDVLNHLSDVIARIRAEVSARTQFSPSPAVRERGPGGEG